VVSQADYRRLIRRRTVHLYNARVCSDWQPVGGVAGSRVERFASFLRQYIGYAQFKRLRPQKAFLFGSYS